MVSKTERKVRRRRGNVALAIGFGLCVGLGFGLVLHSVVFGASVGIIGTITLWAAGVGARKEVARQEE